MIDDLIAAVVKKCEHLNISDNTYIFFTTDHGFQLGQFNIIMDKRQIYDWNTRIPLLVRGPGISLITLITLLMTLLDILYNPSR